ncbi:histidine kinase [Sanguibacter suaedae]|uniref:histidine kinase n=1 Tax=Sanguibacter suaedae TaxID=2795737 RepID=A0A934IBE7_9MICO|nr:histidine kinase [Sanguibacter suaedae]MBI9115595.1 hypothetical protein [Sanguibacter suaedae]
MTITGAPFVPTAGLRTLAGWARRDVITATTAAAVALVLLITPVHPGPRYATEDGVYVATPSPGILAMLVVLVVLAGITVVVGVLVTKRSVVLATALTLVPAVLAVWWQTFVWGWFLGTIGVAVIAASMSWRRATLPYGAALAVAAVHCVGQVPALLPLGFVSVDPTLAGRLEALAVHVVVITAVVAASAGVSTSPRALVEWCRREPLTLLCVLTVALFLQQTGVLTSPMYIEETNTFLYHPLQGALSAVSVLGHVSVVAGVLLAKRSAVWATTLTLLPFVVLPWWQTFAWGWLLGTIAVAVIVASESWRRAVLPTVAALAVSVFYCVSYTPALLPIGMVTAGTTSGRRVVAMALYVVFITGIVSMSAGIGATARAQRLRNAADEQHERAVHAEVVTSERAQVARDLHDVVAHHVSLVAVRAESAPYQHPGLDDRTLAILGEIADDARQALAELRQVLVVLQRAEGSGDGGASRAPQPDAADVDELVVSARAAGQEVDVDGAWGAVPPAQGYVLYRAVQEGLTNARRHAPREVVTVTRTRERSTVGVTLSNPVRRPRTVAPGRGLVGMRERVEALGGTMVASVEEGRFTLAVTLPVDVTVNSAVEVGA